MDLLFIKDLLHYINPETIIDLAGPYVLVILWGIIFAETGLLAGFFLPGDSLLFLVGLYTATGVIDYPILLILGLLISAAIIGDQTGYIIGRKIGPALFKRPESRFFKPAYVERTKAFYDRHGGKAIIIGRFVPIVRTFVPVIAGVAQLAYRKFVFFNIAGGMVWITSMTMLGYLPVIIAGPDIAETHIKPNVKYITIVIILISVIPIITTALSERRRARQAQP
ncbi:MAG: VTT domain-containing protein [Bacteroidetes bacterium]|nr:VTT domain-containing protein [Bacteroidota bacterium]